MVICEYLLGVGNAKQQMKGIVSCGMNLNRSVRNERCGEVESCRKWRALGSNPAKYWKSHAPNSLSVASTTSADLLQTLQNKGRVHHKSQKSLVLFPNYLNSYVTANHGSDPSLIIKTIEISWKGYQWFAWTYIMVHLTLYPLKFSYFSYTYFVIWIFPNSFFTLCFPKWRSWSVVLSVCTFSVPTRAHINKVLKKVCGIAFF